MIRAVILLFLFLFSSPAWGAPTLYANADATRSGTTGIRIPLGFWTTNGAGTSQFVKMPERNLVHAFVPEAVVYSSGDSNVQRGLGSATKTGVTGWYRDPLTGLLQHYKSGEIPIQCFGDICGYSASAGLTNYSTAERFSAAVWTKTRSGVTAGATDPTNRDLAYRLWEDSTAANSHLIQQQINQPNFLDNSLVTFSLFAKPDSRSWIALFFRTKDNDFPQAFFNVSTGAIGTTSGVSSAWISDETYNGFYRIAITANIESDTTHPIFYAYLADADNSTSYDGDGVSGLTIFGAMVSETPSAGPYVPSDGAIQPWSAAGTGNAGALTYQLSNMTFDPLNGVVSATTMFGEQLGEEISAGTLQIGDLYKISADNLGGHWFGSPVSSATGMYFVEVSGTTTADGNNKVQRVLNSYNSGTTEGLSPPHFTMIALIRSPEPYNLANQDGEGIISLQSNSTHLLFLRSNDTGGNGQIKTYDGTTLITETLNWAAGKWIIAVIEAGRLNNNVSQYRINTNSGSGWSWGTWVDYDGSYDLVGTNLVFARTGNAFKKYIHIGPVFFYSTIFPASFYEALGNGG